MNRVLTLLAFLFTGNAFAMDWKIKVHNSQTSEDKYYTPTTDKEFNVPLPGISQNCLLNRVSISKDEGIEVEARTFLCLKAPTSSMGIVMTCINGKTMFKGVDELVMVMEHKAKPISYTIQITCKQFGT